MLHGSGIFMGADSECNNGSHRGTIRMEKIVRYDNMLIGVCGQPRATQILHASFTPPEHPEEMSVMQYLTDPFTNALRKALSKHGCLRTDAGVESFGSTLLIGYAGSLYTLESNFQLIELDYPYAAIGSGDEVALGALHVASEYVPAPVCVLSALAATEELSCGVRSPFRLYHLPTEGGPSELDIDTLLAGLAPHGV
jgi:ATP-dependent protease HslVU (ClpYQ) peptidase subunit